MDREVILNDIEMLKDKIRELFNQEFKLYEILEHGYDKNVQEELKRLELQEERLLNEVNFKIEALE